MILQLKMAMRLCKLCVFLLLFFSTHVNSQNAHANFLKSEQSNFIVTYTANCPDSLKLVVDFAVSIWSQYLHSAIPIVLHVSWQSLSPTVHAYARPTLVTQNITGLPFTDISFPISLAEKLTNTNHNFNNPDIELVINSTLSWNYDYTSYPVENKHDLTTIVLHELAHGLGFMGNVSMKGSELFIDNYPLIYDTFIVSDTISYLSLFNNSLVSQDSLISISTSNNISWNGPYSYAFLGTRPDLFAPNPYNPGSSFYHFNDGFVPPSDSLTLMKRSFDLLDILHQPDIATISLLADIGWIDFFIQHTPLQNVASVDSLISFQVTCNEEYIDTSFVELLYSYDGGKNFVAKQIFYNVDSLCFVDSFPLFPFERTVNYAFKTKSLHGDTIIFPSFFPYYTYSFFVGEDLNPPVIEHDPPTKISVDTDTLKIRASFYDYFSIDSSYIQIFIGRNDFSTILAQEKILFHQDLYGAYADIPISNYNASEGDQLAYNIFSVDKYGNESSFLPHGEYIIVPIEPNRIPLHYFITDFEADSISDDFYLDKFSIYKEIDFDSKALHTEHPYASSFIDRQYVQYIAELKNPIILSDNPSIMQFDEVVLVEPSESGVAFGMYGFWDYVVVEGAQIGNSEEWHALGKNGYDSRLHTDWLTTYSSLLTPENNNSSIALGTQEMLKSHTINLLENKYFRTGDTIFIRFRLQSDFNRNGWGWTIDNLSIQEKNLQIINKSKFQYIVYPNPFSSQLCVAQEFNVRIIRFFNLLGTEVLSYDMHDSDCVTVTTLPPGMYSVVIETDVGSFVEKVIKYKL